MYTELRPTIVSMQQRTEAQKRRIICITLRRQYPVPIPTDFICVISVFLDDVESGVSKRMISEIQSKLSVLTSIGRVCAIVCCCGCYQVLLWLWLLLTGSFSLSDILLTICVILGLGIIYVVVMFAVFDEDVSSSGASLLVLCGAFSSLSYALVEALTKINKEPSRSDVFVLFIFAAVKLLFCCGISKMNLWLSKLHPILLLFLLMLLGLFVSSTVNR